MRLESVLAATGGRLLNTPSVSRFEGMSLRLSQVERGVLYLTDDPATIPDALGRGAYGILTDTDTEITDDEVAWIRVSRLEEALPRLLRLELMERPRSFWYVPPATLAYLRQLGVGRERIVLPEPPSQRYETILHAPPDRTLLCDDIDFLDRLGVRYTRVKTRRAAHRLLAHTLFESTLIIEGTYLGRLRVPPCTLPAFLHAVALLDSWGVIPLFGAVGGSPDFDPIFVDAEGRERGFGESDRVVILSRARPDCRCLEAFDAIHWLPRRLFVPSHLKFDCAIKATIERFESPERLFDEAGRTLWRRGYTLVGGFRRREFAALAEAWRRRHESNRTKGLF